MHQSNTIPPSDLDLLADFIASRSESAFRQLADRHAPWIFAAALRQLRDRHLAEDATQAVFLFLAQKAHAMSLPQKQKLAGWLFTTLHYIVRNLQRAGHARRKHEQQRAAQTPEPLESVPHPADPVEAAALATILDAAVARLSDPDRTAILLRFYQNRPVDDIAATLRISEAAARKRLTRALARLRHLLTRHSPTQLPADSFTPATLALAATHGLQSAPASLTLSIAHVATASAAGGAVPVSIATTLKGATTLMATAKLQTALLSSALALALFVPTALITYRLTAHATTPTTPIATATLPDSQPADVDPTYTLKPDQLIALIPPPFPDSRADLVKSLRRPHPFRAINRPNAPDSQPAPVNIAVGAGSGEANTRILRREIITPNGGAITDNGGGADTGAIFVPNGGGGVGGGGGGAVTLNGQVFRFTPNTRDPDAMILQFQPDHPLAMLSSRDSTRGNNFFTLRDLLQTLFNLSPESIEGQQYLLDRKLPGDFLVRKTPDDQLLPALQKLLAEQLDLPLTLSFHNVAAAAYTLKGKWNTNPDGSSPDVHLYTDDNSDLTSVGNGQVSPASALGGVLTRFLHVPVSIDAENPPPRITFITHRAGRNPDPALVLTHLAEQTGLTWSKESRPFRHLLIETR